MKLHNLKAKWYRFLSRFVRVYVFVDGGIVSMVLSNYPIHVTTFDGLERIYCIGNVQEEEKAKQYRESIVRDMSLHTCYVAY